MENAAAAADEWKDDQREIRQHKSNFLGLQQMRKQYDVFPLFITTIFDLPKSFIQDEVSRF